MTNVAEAARASGVTIRAALSVLQLLGLTESQYPTDTTLTNGSTYDYIIVGAGTAGSVLANRLSADGNYTVMVVEAGGYPPLESDFPATFMFTRSTDYDFNYTTVNDNYTMQNLIGKNFSLIQPKLLGGCSSNNHMLYNPGDYQDFEAWMNKTNDTAWNVTNLIPYYEKQKDMIHVTKDPRPETTNILNSLKELGNSDLTCNPLNLFLGYDDPWYTINDGRRLNSALAYLKPAKNRSNLFLSLFTTATKILIKNKTATGVQVTKDDNTYLLYAKKEVIVSAGVINSPKLLMLSGIGPRSHLESLGIEVVADLPVGQSFLDQTAVPVLFEMENSTSTSGAVDRHRFPVPAIVGNKALNSSTNSSVYQAIILGFDANSTSLLNLCSLLFTYSDDICQSLYKATTNKITWLSLIGLTLPESQGNVSLASANPDASPIIYSGAFSNSADLTLISKALLDHIQLVNTTYFKSVNASVLDAGLCEGSMYDLEYWKCYALAMSTTIWHSGGTCAVGEVVDSNMLVKDMESLRVVDSSVMPALVKGGIACTVGMLGELASDLILGS